LTLHEEPIVELWAIAEREFFHKFAAQQLECLCQPGGAFGAIVWIRVRMEATGLDQGAEACHIQFVIAEGIEAQGEPITDQVWLPIGSARSQCLLKMRPSDLNILNMVAEAYYDKGKYQQAIDYWDQCLTYDKQNASALYMIGLCYQKKGEKAKGQQLCDKAIEMDPSLASLKQKKQMMGL